MKHILPILTAALALMTTAAFADTAPFSYKGFTVTPKEYDNKGYQGIGDGDFYVVEFTADSKLYLFNHLNNLSKWDTTSEALSTMGITDYGYYKNGSSTLTDSFSLVKGNENYVEPESFTFSLDPTKTNGQTSLTRTGYLLGDFKAGDKVEIWMTDGYTSVSSDTLLPLGEGGSAYAGRFNARADMVTTYSSDGTVIPVAQLYLYNSPTQYQVNFGLYAVGAGEGGDTIGTAGSPLPGGLQIALIAGLSGLGFWYIRRRKAIAA